MVLFGSFFCTSKCTLKKQGTYFKICLTYFKISQTYFLPFENRMKTAFENVRKNGEKYSNEK